MCSISTGTRDVVFSNLSSGFALPTTFKVQHNYCATFCESGKSNKCAPALGHHSFAVKSQKCASHCHHNEAWILITHIIYLNTNSNCLFNLYFTWQVVSFSTKKIFQHVCVCQIWTNTMHHYERCWNKKLPFYFDIFSRLLVTSRSCY